MASRMPRDRGTNPPQLHRAGQGAGGAAVAAVGAEGGGARRRFFCFSCGMAFITPNAHDECSTPPGRNVTIMSAAAVARLEAEEEESGYSYTQLGRGWHLLDTGLAPTRVSDDEDGRGVVGGGGAEGGVEAVEGGEAKEAQSSSPLPLGGAGGGRGAPDDDSRSVGSADTLPYDDDEGGVRMTSL